MQDIPTPLPVTLVAGNPPIAEQSLTLHQVRALSYRAATGADSNTEVASVAGVSESTVRYWRNTNPRFAELWDRAPEHLEEIAKALRQQGRVKSLETLLRVQDAECVPDSVKVDAAAKFLTNDRQERDRESEPAKMMWAAMLEHWAQRSDEILHDAPGDDGIAVDGAARPVD